MVENEKWSDWQAGSGHRGCTMIKRLPVHSRHRRVRVRNILDTYWNLNAWIAYGVGLR